MLLRLLTHAIFEAPRTERLLVLENRLRRKSHGGMALRDYTTWLKEAGVEVPRSRRTLHEDLRRYADFCDDVVYGGNSKILELDSRVTRDATAWLMGRAWADSPLKPYLPSAMVRCLLLAMEEKAEVHFNYRKLRNPGEAWQPNPYWCVPLRLIPGSDAGYIGALRPEGYPVNLSISRISALTEFSGKTLRDYPPPPPPQRVRLSVCTRDVQLRERLCSQFKGLVKQDRETLCLELDKDLALMTWNILDAHLTRTKQADRSIPVEKQYKNAAILCEDLTTLLPE